MQVCLSLAIFVTAQRLIGMTASQAIKNLTISSNVNLQKVLRVSLIVSLIIFTIGFIAFVSSLRPFSKKFVANSTASASASGPLSGGSISALGAVASSTGKSPMLELNIADNGLVFMRNAKVVSISDDKKIHVVIGWSDINFSWAVETNVLTKFLDAKGQKADSTTIHVGDTVTVTGEISGSSGSEPLITAEFIRIL